MGCYHVNVAPEICDQTLGVKCLDCKELLGWCWAENHASEALWNRACLNDSEAIPCTENREDVCFLCGKRFGKHCEHVDVDGTRQGIFGSTMNKQPLDDSTLDHLTALQEQIVEDLNDNTKKADRLYNEALLTALQQLAVLRRERAACQSAVDDWVAIARKLAPEMALAAKFASEMLGIYDDNPRAHLTCASCGEVSNNRTGYGVAPVVHKSDCRLTNALAVIQGFTEIWSPE